MPENETKAPPKPKKEDGSPKYTDEQKAKAEQNVIDEAAKSIEKQNKYIDKFVEDLQKQMESEDYNTRTSILDRIAQQVMSIKTVAANAKKFVSRGAVMAEEKASMPRLTPMAAPGETPSRNILAQEDQNKTDINAGGGKK